MSVDLKPCREQLSRLSPALGEILDKHFAEAARIMSPAGLHRYVEGAKALSQLGRGADLVATYLEELPAVVKEVGETVIEDTITAALKLSSMVSGEIIALLLASLPTAAKRLGDADLLRQYLNLVHQLSARAPRGLRPMLSRVDELFSKLTLGGLRRWALWGAQAHARDFQAQIAYFSLESPDSVAVLQQERRGVLFVDVHRRLNFYLRALWGRDFFLRPTSGDYETREGYKPFIEKRVIHLPDAFDDFGDLPGKDLYRAAAAHAAAHLVYMTAPVSAQELTPGQRFFVGVLEDARVEYLAIREFPGLRQLWRRVHQQVAATHCATDRVVGLLERAAFALLDPQHRDTNPWVRSIAEAFWQRIDADAENSRLSRELGLKAYHDLQAHTPIPSLRVLESFGIPYRDDNRYLWAFDEEQYYDTEYVPASHRQVRKHVSVIEMVNELDCELAGDDAQEIWILDTEFFRDGDPENVSINQLEGREPVSRPYHYPEWDYQVQLHRPDWVTVVERRQPRGQAESIDAILTEYRPLATRIKRIIDSLIPVGLVRKRRQEDGHDIDLDAAISAMVSIRMGETPDYRVNLQFQRKTRDLAVLILLDLSQSTNETLGGSERSVLQLTREACALLSWAIDGIGDPFAIHGFASDGRHDVQYYRFKDFSQAYDEEAKARLAGMRGGLSTRMGAALRHARMHLSRQPQQKKLLILVSDGEPADIDVKDPQYLRQDTKKAVEELGQNGIMTYCLTLDPDADDYVARIFGVNRYTIVDRVEKLPEKLPTLFMTLTR